MARTRLNAVYQAAHQAWVLVIAMPGVLVSQFAIAAASPEHFHLFPIFDALSEADALGQVVIGAEMQKLIDRLGPAQPPIHLGFSFIYTTESGLRTVCAAAEEKFIQVGLIMNVQNHNLLHPIAAHMNIAQPADLRLHQWRLNGKAWHGREAGSLCHAAEVPARDHVVTTLSYGARLVRDAEAVLLRQWAQEILAVQASYPNCIALISVGIEAELAAGGQITDEELGDYSPFAIAQFVDWLRHRGIYEVGASHAGTGAPAEIVGTYIFMEGAWRSPFWGHLSPDAGHDGRPSFNDHFATQFRNWQLAYWDPKRWPEPITRHDTELMPASGLGALPGGFDAPRSRRPSDPFWRAWSYDPADHDLHPPPGYGRDMAWGFRQAMLRQYVNGLVDAVADGGIADQLLYAHQIPGELIGAIRARSSASVAWTGLTERNGHLGLTRFGSWPQQAAESLDLRYGIFEWYPCPPLSPELRRHTHATLDTLVTTGGRALFPGWWEIGGSHPEYPLNDGPLEAAIGDWVRAQDGRPLTAVGKHESQPIWLGN